MTKKEFTDRTGLTEIDDKRFDWINEIYLAAGELDKDAFCAAYLKINDQNPIIKALVEHCEQLAKTVVNLGRELNSAQEKLLETATELENLRALVNATIDEVNLACNDRLRDIFEQRVGKINVMRLRKEAGWTLSPKDIDYLLDHCVEK